MTVTTINSLEQFKEITNGDKVTVFEFWATWCGPCRSISPVFEKLSAQFSSLEFYKVDVDKCEGIVEQVGFDKLPAFAAYALGKRIGQLPGSLSSKLESFVQEVSTQ